MKNTAVHLAQSRFRLKLVCCIAFGSASNSCCLLKSISIVTVCNHHVTYAFQSESTVYSCLNVKELLA